tara:strand:- start:12874 stop:13914 length:1041 start_codon:yes stop_codon:yes gene_type:complete
MAYQGEAYSPKNWELGFALDDTAGVGFGTSGSAVIYGLEVDSFSYPSVGDTRILEQRAGSTGRVLNSSDLQVIKPGSIIEWGASGVPATRETIGFLLANALGKTVASNQLTLTTGYTWDAFAKGAGADWDKTFGLYLKGVAPDSNADSYNLGGCVITSLTLTANANENGGRWMMDFTAQSRSPFEETPNAVPTIDNAYSSNYIYLSEATEISKIMNCDTYVDSISITIENPVVYYGNKLSGTDHFPEAYQRAIPNFNITANATVKYDSNTELLFDAARNLTPVSSGGIFLSNDADIDNANDFGIDIPAMVAEEVALSEGDYMALDISMRMVDNGSADLCNFVVGTW